MRGFRSSVLGADARTFRARAVGLVAALSLGMVVAEAGPAVAAPVARQIDDTCGTAPDAGFTDVPDSNVHRETIACIKHHGITHGKSATTYDPGGTLAADQLASFVVRTLEAGGVVLPAPTRDHFVDDDGNRHEGAINALAEAGIVVTGGAYGVSDTPTRATMSQLMVDALVFAGVVEEGRQVDDHFSDDTGHPNQRAINLIADAGVVTGKGGTRFAPDEALRRDQMATFLARAIDLILDGGSPPEAPPTGGSCGDGTPTGKLVISAIRADAPGNDIEVRNDSEYVELRNPGTADVALTGWQLVDAADNTIVIPGGFSIRAGATFRVYSGAGDDQPTARYFAGRRQAMWNNSGDTAILCDPNGTTVATFSY